MSWRGSSSIQDRFFAILPYAYPMLQASIFGSVLMSQFPVLALLLLPLTPFIFVYGLLSSVLGQFTGLLIFFALYVLVVRNEKINHFIRFNTMQALLIGIAVDLIVLVLQLLGVSLGGLLSGVGAIPTLVIFSTIFIAVMVSSIYSIVCALRGKYGEIPMISEAAYAQVRY
ncbi:MAG: hypothetical protein HC866_12275 [Leptolyngbyaceae cyanobacterium RU_5_1]|nr:hypothetical protein [Leptolyngbyaceae cyanobacterium RU_5_1]